MKSLGKLKMLIAGANSFDIHSIAKFPNQIIN